MPNFFDKYPYTDFHELNLDWIIKTVKETVAEWAVTLTEWHNTQEEWQQLYDYVHDYFDNLDVQQEINNKLDAMALDGSLATIAQPIIEAKVAQLMPGEVSNQIGSAVADQIGTTVAIQLPDEVSDQLPVTAPPIIESWLDDHITQPTTPAIDTSLTIAGAAADAKAAGDAIEDINDNFSDIFELEDYLLATDSYFNGNTHTVTALTGYNCYKIPISEGEVFNIYSEDGLCDSGFGGVHRICIQLIDDSYVNGNTNLGESLLSYFTIAPLNAKYVYVSLENTHMDTVFVNKKLLFPILNGSPYMYKNQLACNIQDISITSTIYIRDDGLYAALGANGISNICRLKNNDKLRFNELAPGYSYYGTFRTDAGVTSRINTSLFTAPADGIVFVFNSTVTPNICMYLPVDSAQIEYSNIINAPVPDNSFDQLNCVAFGTSLTSRSQGYVTHLATLSGMTIDNQGIGSAQIHDNGGDGGILTRIKSYAGYAGKDVAILEGFVNDWYYEPTELGTWSDTTNATVCGCVRIGLEYMLSQNPDLTVFLILDHYGQGINDPLQPNSNGQTQFEWWSEIGKVAESLGIPVIKEYAMSQISNNTPQYLDDNIHCSALGAEQSAYAIWSQMRQYFPNRQ